MRSSRLFSPPPPRQTLCGCHIMKQPSDQGFCDIALLICGKKSLPILPVLLLFMSFSRLSFFPPILLWSSRKGRCFPLWWAESVSFAKSFIIHRALSNSPSQASEQIRQISLRVSTGTAPPAKRGVHVHDRLFFSVLNFVEPSTFLRLLFVQSNTTHWRCCPLPVLPHRRKSESLSQNEKNLHRFPPAG